MSASPEPYAVATSEESRRAARLRFFEHAQEHSPLVAVECDGLTFLVSTADRGVGLRLFTKRTRSDMVALARAVSRLDHAGLGARARRRAFVDVGASLGTACIAAVGLHGFRRALALEPSPENYRLLRANIAVNLLGEHIHTGRLAASRPGVADTTLYRRRAGRYGLRGDRGHGSLTVEAAAVDDLLACHELEAGDVGMLWIDVDGNEGDVLAGASTLLGAGVPLVIEISHGRPPPLAPLVESYARFVDLRADGPVLPVESLARLARSLQAGVDPRQETDVLLLR